MNQDDKRTNDMFYKNLFENVYKYIYFRVGNKHDAEDMTSETVTRIIEKKDLSEVQNINFFAIGIARNVMADHFNKNKKMNTTGTSLDDMTEMEFADDMNLDESVLNNEMIELIKNELKNLDELTSEIIVLRVWQNMQFSEIAEITSLKEMAVKQRFYRGVDTLKMSLNKPKNSYKAYSFTLPIILAGAKVMFGTSEFAAAGSFISGLVSGITKLNIILPSMATIEMTTVGATKAAGGFLSTTAAKIIAVVVGTGTIVGGGFVVANIAAPDSNSDLPNKTTVENIVSKAGSEVEKVELSEFKSERYDLNFKYPSSMGDVKVQFQPEFFNNERLTFSNSKLAIEYLRFEGGHGPTRKLGEATSPQGLKIEIYAMFQGDLSDEHGVVAMLGDSSKGSIRFIAQGLNDQEEVDATVANIKTIFENLNIDLSLIVDSGTNSAQTVSNLISYSSSHFNLSFDYADDLGAATGTFSSTNQTITGNISCDIENITFSGGNALNIRSIKGAFECDGASGGNVLEEFGVTTKNGLTSTVYVVDTAGNPNFANAMVSFRSSNVSYRILLQWQLPVDSSKKLTTQSKERLVRLIESINFEPGLKN